MQEGNLLFMVLLWNEFSS